MTIYLHADCTTKFRLVAARSLMAIDDERFARTAKALADPRRFQILETIAARGEVEEGRCGEQARRLLDRRR